MGCDMDAIEKIVLASASPARRALLEEEGLTVLVRPTGCNEQCSLTDPASVVTELAARKLKACMDSADFDSTLPALACDTLIALDGRLIGKAASEVEARGQILAFSGRTHTVFSGYALYLDGKVFNGFDSTDVTFRKIGDAELENYIKGGSWKGAAGSYHIRGSADAFIERVDGSIATVIGLPLEKISDIIKTLRK